jgi:hypothetical protein
MLTGLTVSFFFGTCCVAQGAEETIALSNPEIGWAMKVKAPGFALEQRQVEPGGHAYFMASDRDRQMILSGRIEKAQKAGTAKNARDYFWEETKKIPFKMDDVKMSESGKMATVEYMIREHMGIPVNQKNLWGYFAKDQYWMNVHISKTGFRPGEEGALKQILESVSVEEKVAGRRVETAYRVNEKQVIVLEVPEKWLDEIDRLKDFPPTIILKPDSMPAMAVHVTPMWNPGPEVDFNSPERIRKILEDGGTRLLAEAVEKELKLQELKGKTGLGYYFTLTDKAPSIKPGEFKYMSQGGIPVGDLLVMFTIFYNAKHSADAPIAREIITNAVQK